MTVSTEENKRGLAGQPVDAIFFDWDRTLAYINTPQNTLSERLAMMFALGGLSYTQSEIESALDSYEKDAAVGKVPAVLLQPQRRRDIARYYKRLLDYLGEGDTSWPVMKRLYSTYALLPTYLYEDSRPILSLLREQGYQLGIISNHSTSARPVIERLVGDLIPPQNILISEEVGVHKPAKTIFKRAASRIKIDPTHCRIYVGDNLDVDAVGSLDSGEFCDGIWLDRQNIGVDQSLPSGVIRITALYELPLLLEAGRKNLGKEK
jgi:FMN phosphatase YigB (HAD superfamily)